jgi:hypothetical protein
MKKRAAKQTNNELFKVWSTSVGGAPEATFLIMKATGMSASTAEKLANGRYPSVPSKLIQKALSRLTGFPVDDLFPATQSSEQRKEAS